MKNGNSNNENKATEKETSKQVKAMKTTKATTKKTAPATAKATEATNNNKETAPDTQKAMQGARLIEIELQMQELEDKKRQLKRQLNEQKKAQRLEYQVQDKVVNLLERFAQIGVQLIANAKTIYEGTKDDNIANLSLAISKSVEGLNPLLQIFGIDLQELRNNVKPLSARGNKTDRTPREQRKLADYGIKDGDRLIYAPTGDAYEVLDNGVIVEGKRYALSTAVKILKNNPGGSYSGYKFFRIPDHTEALIDTAVIE